MNITLHAATEQVRALLDQIDPETGEMPEGYEDARALVQRKAVATTAYLLESERQTDAVEAYIKELVIKVKAERRRQEWLRRYLADHMSASGIRDISDERGIFHASLAVGRDEAVEVYDEAQLPQDCLREIPARHEADKALIKRALKDGYDIPGARLVKRDRLTIK